jgi:hypothetical protein
VCKISDHSLTPCLQNEYSYCEKSTKIEKALRHYSLKSCSEKNKILFLISVRRILLTYLLHIFLFKVLLQLTQWSSFMKIVRKFLTTQTAVHIVPVNKRYSKINFNFIQWKTTLQTCSIVISVFVCYRYLL